MPWRNASPRCVKVNRSYTIAELAACCGVHKNTVRHWVANGLATLGTERPLLLQGALVRAFLAKRRAVRKRPCPPGMLYCLRCRAPRPPALGMIDFVQTTARAGNIRALCGTCEAVMHRRARRADLPRIMPACTIQIVER